MKERPIIFNGDLVRAILEGRKTQTRRPCRAQQMAVAGFEPWFGCEDGYQFWVAKTCPADLKAKAPDRSDHLANVVTKCPFGQIGDRLWVREAWGLVSPEQRADWHALLRQRPHRMHPDSNDYDGAAAAVYLADGNLDLIHGADGQTYKGWRPSIHMPRWASRLTLEITDIRVQRLQKITENDAEAEGVEIGGEGQVRTQWNYYVDAFACAWDSIYARRNLGWSADPWVWAITFRRLEQTHGCPETPNSANCGISDRATLLQVA